MAVDPIIRTDAYVRHELDIQRFAVSTSNKFRAENISKVENAYATILAQFDDVNNLTEARKLATTLANKTSEVLESEIAAIGVELELFTESETNWNKNTLSIVIGETVSAALPETVLRRSGQHIMSGGQTVNEFLASTVESNKKLAKQAIFAGWQEGRTNAQIRKDIIGSKQFRFMDGNLQKVRRNVDAAIRTQINAISDTARLQTFKANSDIVANEMILATLDHRTSQICQFYDKQVFKLGEGPRPPFHPNCRSLTIPLFKGETAGDITGKRPAVNAGPGFESGDTKTRTGRVRKPRRGDDRFKITRTNASQTSYDNFLRRQPASYQDDILGKTKGVLFRKHKLSVEDMVKTTRKGYYQRPLTVKELERKVSGDKVILAEGTPPIPTPTPAPTTAVGTWTKQNLKQFTDFKKSSAAAAKESGGNGVFSTTINGRNITLVIKNNKVTHQLDGKTIPVSKFRTALKDFKGVAKPTPKPPPVPPKAPTPAPKPTVGVWTKQNLKDFVDFKKETVAIAKERGGNFIATKTINGREITLVIKNGKVTHQLNGRSIPAGKFRAALKDARQAGPIIKPAPKNDLRSFSFVPEANTDAMDVINRLGTKQADEFKKFISKRNVKAVYTNALNETAPIEMKRKLTKELGIPTSGDHIFYGGKRVNGFTNKAWNHVVTKIKPFTNFSKIKTSALKDTIEEAISDAQAGLVGRQWTFGSLAKLKHSQSHGEFMTLIHEIGHQVHFWAGTPDVPRAYRKTLPRGSKDNFKSATDYGGTITVEWHAEHFVAWLLNRDALFQFDPDIAEYFDRLMTKALRPGASKFGF